MWKFLVPFFFLPSAFAASTLNVDLTAPTVYDFAQSSLGIVANTVLGQVQASLAPSGAVGKEVDFGNGSDGVFNDGPPQTGISVSGPNITFDTGAKSKFNFKTFNLSVGNTINVIGPNPLWIRVLGNATVSGTILGAGGAGNDNLPNPAAGPNFGGFSIASGGAGGNGGTSASALGTPGITGTPMVPILIGPSGALAGGGSGTDQTALGNDQGGGGGCNGSGPDALNDAKNGQGALNKGACAVSRSAIALNFENLFLGGAGGGGGGPITTGGGPLWLAGGGGGGGGGAIRLTSLQAITVNGVVSVQGGTGGADSSCNVNGDCAGGGGGGSGGSVWFQSGQAVAGAGVVSVSGGPGGGPNYPGGNGSRGVFRQDASGSSVGVFPPGSALNVSFVPAPNQNYVLVSKPLDFSAGFYTFDSVTETLSTVSTGCGSSGTLSVLYESSSDGITFANAVPAAQIAQLNNSPYLRFKVQLSTAAVGLPPCLTALSLQYEPTNLKDIKLTGGFSCGSLDSGGDSKFGGRKPRDTSAPFFEFAAILLIAGITVFTGKNRKNLQG